MFGANKVFWRGYQAPIAAALIPAAIGAIGANKQAKAATSAANTNAAAQTEAARIAAEESRYRPIDMSNLFGSVDWTKDAQGRVSGVNLNPSDYTQGLFGDAGNIYNNYYNLLAGYMQPDLQSGANQIYSEWQNLLTPTRQNQQSQLFSALQNKGITGIEGYDPRTGTAANPFTNSLFNAWGAQDQQMAAQSINEYMNRLQQLMAGTDQSRASMVGVGELPLKDVLDVSSQIGGRNANATGANALMQGGVGAANVAAQGQVASAAYKNNFWNGFGTTMGNSLSGLFGQGATQAPAPVQVGPTNSLPGYTGNSLDWNSLY
jgi:hypothetical protein